MVAKYVKSNPKAFYQYVATKTKNKETIPNLLKTDGSFTENDLGKAELLNDYFSSVFTAEDADNIPSNEPKSYIINSNWIIDEDQIMSLALKN